MSLNTLDIIVGIYLEWLFVNNQNNTET